LSREVGLASVTAQVESAGRPVEGAVVSTHGRGESPAADAAGPAASAGEDEDTHTEVVLEASTMALYVSVVLLAALVALEDDADIPDAEMLGLIWGTTLGLALAHFFAFRMSSRLVRGSTFHRRDLVVARAQAAGAVAVAALCTIPVLLLPNASEYDVVRLELGLLLGLAGYASGRTGGASRLRSLVMGAVTLVLGIGVALVKNALLGH
jgi:hypothetical protein